MSDQWICYTSRWCFHILKGMGDLRSLFTMDTIQMVTRCIQVSLEWSDQWPQVSAVLSLWGTSLNLPNSTQMWMSTWLLAAIYILRLDIFSDRYCDAPKSLLDFWLPRELRRGRNAMSFRWDKWSTVGEPAFWWSTRLLNPCIFSSLQWLQAKTIPIVLSV